jgi:hypothetical protein
VNLPKSNKLAAPRYQDITGEKVKLVSSPDGGALIRVIAGEIGGYHGPGSTYTPIALTHTTIAPGASLTLPWNPEFNAVVYVMAGSGTVGPEQRPIEMGQTAVFGPGHTGDSITVRASDRQDQRTGSLEVFILGGKPIREPIAMAGPFVMNTRQEVIDAFEDFQAGRLGAIPAAHAQL